MDFLSRKNSYHFILHLIHTSYYTDFSRRFMDSAWVSNICYILYRLHFLHGAPPSIPSLRERLVYTVTGSGIFGPVREIVVN
jgi:hypothetical protein